MNSPSPEPSVPTSDRTPDDLLEEAIRVKAEDPATAVVLLNQAHKMDPRHQGVLQQIGLLFLRVRHYDQAASCFEQLISLDQTNAEYWSTLGVIFSHSDRPNEAIDTLQKSIRIDKRNADAYYHLGRVYRRLKNTSMARYAFREAIKNEPRLGIAYFELGQTYAEAGSLQQAMDQYKKALEATPTLEVARKAMEAAKQARSDQRSREQFGRLVSMPDLQTKADKSREETTEPQPLVAHYDSVRSILKAIKPATEKLTKHLVENLCPLLRHAMRDVTGSADRATLLDTRDRLREELRRVAAGRNELRKLAARFAAHTEMASGVEAKT